MNAVNITEQSKALFIAYANDACNWSGSPMVGGNVGGSKEDAGRLTQLKKAGLVETFKNDGIVWLDFTEAGKAFADSLDINVRP